MCIRDRFNSWGLLASITDINGFTTALSYDAAYKMCIRDSACIIVEPA